MLPAPRTVVRSPPVQGRPRRRVRSCGGAAIRRGPSCRTRTSTEPEAPPPPYGPAAPAPGPSAATRAAFSATASAATSSVGAVAAGPADASSTEMIGVPTSTVWPSSTSSAVTVPARVPRALARHDGYAALGPGERIVFEPYSRQAYEQSRSTGSPGTRFPPKAEWARATTTRRRCRSPADAGARHEGASSRALPDRALGRSTRPPARS